MLNKIHWIYHIIERAVSLSASYNFYLDCANPQPLAFRARQTPLGTKMRALLHGRNPLRPLYRGNPINLMLTPKLNLRLPRL